MFLVSKINVRKGHTGYEDEHVGSREITPHQKSLLIELGEKISTVSILPNTGRLLIFKTGVFNLHHLRSLDVYHHHLPH